MKKVILASKSPRRKELLERFGFPFTCVDANTEEVLDASLPIPQAIEQIAWHKAQSVSKMHPDAIVIAADTVVELDGVIYGKPSSTEDARAMLQGLSGNIHRVITAVCIYEGERSETFHSIANVEFYSLSVDEINSYVETKEPMDKAGAYGIQGYGSFLVKRIDGDFFSIMGLPVALLSRKLRKWQEKSAN